MFIINRTWNCVILGNKTSKKSKDISARTYATELRSYEAACKEDREIQSFDTRMQGRTSRVMSTLGTGGEDRAPSFDTLKVVTESLLAMHQEVVNVMLDCKEDIWKNKEMFEVVEAYLETSVKMVDFCDALERSLQRVRRTHRFILVALQQFNEESRVQGGNGYKKTLKELKNYKDAESSFGEDFFMVFQSLCKQQKLMLEKLQHRENKLNKKLKRIHTWRKLSSFIFVATWASLLICSVLAAAMAAPALAVALPAATAEPLRFMGKWIDSLWKNYENALNRQKEVISSMQAGTNVTITDLKSIGQLIEQLETEITKMVKSAELAVDHNAVNKAIDAIKENLEEFRKNVEELGNKSKECSRDIKMARNVFLQRIVENGSSST